MKNQSIFIKQVFLYVGTLFVSFLLLGMTLSIVYTRRYMNEMQMRLIEQGKLISKEYSRAYFTGSFENLDYELKALENFTQASIVFINRNGVVVKTSSDIKEEWIGQAIANQEIIEGVLYGNVVTVEGRLGGMFDEPVLIVGYPIRVGQMAGIFMCTSMPEIEQSLNGMYKAGLSSLLLVMMFGIIVVYYLSIRITKPMLSLNEAAKVIAGGNFEHRVEIVSDDEVGQLADSFNHMAESLNNYEKVRREFIANVSHDLRSPLTSMQGFLNAILDGTVPVEKQDKYLRIVLEETKRLSKLTNDIVDLSRAQESNITLECSRFDVNKLIRSNILRVEPRLNDKKLLVNAVFEHQETFVFADSDKIDRVIYNLIDNAIKFSPAESKIEVETTWKDNKVIIQIQDSGPGISKEDQKFIFDRFYKADSSRGEDKLGSGLGLSIVKEFLLAHGENIAVKSQPGKGAEFIFSLRLTEQENEI